MSSRSDLELELNMLDLLRRNIEERLQHFQGLDGKLVTNKERLIQHWSRKLDVLDRLRAERELMLQTHQIWISGET